MITVHIMDKKENVFYGNNEMYQVPRVGELINMPIRESKVVGRVEIVVWTALYSAEITVV